MVELSNPKEADDLNIYIKNNKNYSKVTTIADDEKSKNYYHLVNVNNVNAFYQPDTYYFKSGNDYLADRYGKFDKNKEYYTVEETKITSEFFVANKYYEKVSEGVFQKTADTTLVNGKTYYEQRMPYVYEDPTGEFPFAYEWNPAYEKPAHINLRIRKKIYVMQTLEGFARTYNTIHGLILEIRKMLDNGHKDTRDDNTVQGVINKLNDIIVKFNDLQPNFILMTDKYGRINNVALLELPLGLDDEDLGVVSDDTFGKVVHILMDAVNNAVDIVNGYNTRLTNLEDTVIPALDDRIKTIEETDIPALSDRVTTLEQQNLDSRLQNLEDVTIPGLESDIQELQERDFFITGRYEELVADIENKIYSDSITLDKTYAEILEAYKTGQKPILKVMYPQTDDVQYYLEMKPMSNEVEKLQNVLTRLEEELLSAPEIIKEAIQELRDQALNDLNEAKSIHFIEEYSLPLGRTEQSDILVSIDENNEATITVYNIVSREQLHELVNYAIEAAETNPDWEATHGVAFIENKPFYDLETGNNTFS